MSKEQAIAFFEEISKNTQLAQEVEKVVRSKGSDEAKAKELISLAQRFNFKFTPEEAASAQEALKKPLSPDEMLEVSGGKFNLKSSLMAMALLAGLGAAGAALSNMEASAMKRSTPPDGSYSFGGKRGKIDPPNSTQGQTLPGFDELVSGLSNRAPQGQPATTGTQQQTTPQPVDAITPEQGETPPSNSQRAAQRNSEQPMIMTPPLRASTTSSAERHAPRQQQERKVRKNKEHNKKVAKRYSKNLHCAPDMIERVRSRASSGALPAATWPAFPRVNMAAEKGICRFCGGSLCPTGEGGTVVNCDTAGCVYNWVFYHTGATRNAYTQRGQQDYGHYARWALLPALILDSRAARINSTGKKGMGTARSFAIETPAEAWAVWQLIVGHNNAWINVIDMLLEQGVSEDIASEVCSLLEESYDNLVQGNESFIDLGSAVQQLVAGYNDSWQQVRTTMDQRGYDENTVNTAIAQMEHAYNMLTDEQRQLGAQQWQQWQQAEEARRQAREEARRQAREEARRQEEASRQEEAARQQREEKRRLWIEAWQRGDRQCPRCGGSNVVKNGRGNGTPQCLCKDCRAENGGKGGYFKAPKETVPLEENKQQPQLEIQPIKPNQNIPQLPHLQPHRSMILENTNETFTPLETANLDAISDALVNEISQGNPDVDYIEGLLQRAREVQNPGHSVNGFTTFNDLIDFALEVANDFGRDDIISLIDSWRYSQGK